MHFRPSRPPKANEPFRSNMAATWAAPGVNFGRAHLAPISAQFGSNMVQLCPQLGPFKMGQSQPNRKSSRRVLSLVFPTFFGIDDASGWAMFSILCLHWAPTWCRQRVPICATGGDLGFHLHHMLSIWAWGPRSPLGGGRGPSWAQPGSI